MDSASNLNFDVLTLDDFRLWSDDALRCFLSLRAKPITGSSSELAARAFICYEESIPVNETQEHLLRQNLESYKQKLIINSSVLPDPFTLKDGWIVESDESRGMWPHIFITDIADYLKMHSSAELVTRMCNEYKQGKAYR